MAGNNTTILFIYDAARRNHMSEVLYGYTAAEALGKTAPDIIIGPTYLELASLIIQRAVKGEIWSGQFPVRTKRGDNFDVITTLAPCRDDDNGTIFGVTCVCTDAPHFRQQPTHACALELRHTAIVSKISNLASQVKMKIKTNMQDHHSHIRPTCFGRPQLHNNDQQQDSGSYSCGTSISWSINSDFTIKTDIHTENLDVVISWDDLIIREQLGKDVAVKIFNKEDFPDDMILSFRKEVCLMKRLRYPNILLFMGAVVSPQHLCIVTEFLPCGSLVRLLQHNTIKLDWRRHVHMAMDVARGMNYLHHCQPPIIHRNLKSSNILVDNNWTLKVGEFGLSRIKHETYLATSSRTGTPKWIAPEVLRNEQEDEKSDVYSYGVLLWEITTGKIPWENLNSMQVIRAVGFMDQRLEIPDDVHPQWASLIESCWSREPQSRPTFQEILSKLKVLQKKKF